MAGLNEPAVDVGQVIDFCTTDFNGMKNIILNGKQLAAIEQP
jgi:hypothetical protein